jgi:hypothetical protein
VKAAEAAISAFVASGGHDNKALARNVNEHWFRPSADEMPLHGRIVKNAFYW